MQDRLQLLRSVNKGFAHTLLTWAVFNEVSTMERKVKVPAKAIMTANSISHGAEPVAAQSEIAIEVNYLDYECNRLSSVIQALEDRLVMVLKCDVLDSDGSEPPTTTPSSQLGHQLRSDSESIRCSSDKILHLIHRLSV